MRKVIIGWLSLVISFYSSGGYAERASLIVDIQTNQVLYAHNANLPAYPASLTKLMTVYLIFEAIENQKLSLTDQFIASKTAQAQIGSRLGLREGDVITVKELVLALIVRSANDAAIVAAEALASTEAEFVRQMNFRTRVLGMKDTVFKNASGLPDPEQVTTARDLAVLAVAIQKRYPRHFHLFSVKTFSYKNRDYKTHNHFTNNYAGAHGLKTGFTCNAGYNLVTLVRRNKQQLIGVVLGEESSKQRDILMASLMDKALEKSMKVDKNLTLDRLRYQQQYGAGGNANLTAIAISCGSKSFIRKPVLASSS